MSREMGTRHRISIRTGQRKRVNVAIEVVACPKVLLLDEPTSGLDTVSCDDLFELLQLIKFSAAGPVTIITVIHQPSHELFEKIDEVFFLTPLCCLAYQGPRLNAKNVLKQRIFANTRPIPPPRHNDCDTCFIMLTNAKDHVDNHRMDDEQTVQLLRPYSWQQRAWYPFFYVLRRSIRQIYVRGIVAEAAYMFAYFLLGTCVGFLFENKFQATCDMSKLTTIYFLITLSFGILTCISSQRLFGVEITDQTFERESRNYYHPFQYWLAKSIVDVFRLVVYPLLFLSMLYIEIVPRGSFAFYLRVMVLCSFVCSGIGQLVSVIFDRTEYAYLAGTIVALLSCLLSGFSPSKVELKPGDFIVVFSFSRHVQSLLFRHESKLYAEGLNATEHIWGTSVEGLTQTFDFNNAENPNFWALFIGFLLRALTLLFLYGKSEYRSKTRFRVTTLIPTIKGLLTGESCRDRPKKKQQQPQMLTQRFSVNSPFEASF